MAFRGKVGKSLPSDVCVLMDAVSMLVINERGCGGGTMVARVVGGLSALNPGLNMQKGMSRGLLGGKWLELSRGSGRSGRSFLISCYEQLLTLRGREE